MRHWTELLTIDTDGNEMRLTDFLSECQEGALIGNITLDQFGQLATWDQRYVYFPGEEPGPETPRAPVDWQGFSSVVAAIVEPDDGTMEPTETERQSRQCGDCLGKGFIEGDGFSEDTANCGSCGGLGYVPI